MKHVLVGDKIESWMLPGIQAIERKTETAAKKSAEKYPEIPGLGGLLAHDSLRWEETPSSYLKKLEGAALKVLREHYEGQGVTGKITLQTPEFKMFFARFISDLKRGWG